MRYLGKKLHGNYKGELKGDYKARPVGIRIKYVINGNFLKMYNKKGMLLRIESVINNPYCFKVFRTTEGKPDEKPRWLLLRKGVADVKRRTEISQKMNERYLEGLTSISTDQSIKDIVADICYPSELNGNRIRALRPWSFDDNKLLKTIGRGEYQINGFVGSSRLPIIRIRCIRNKDLRQHLYSEIENANPMLKRKLSSA